MKKSTLLKNFLWKREGKLLYSAIQTVFEQCVIGDVINNAVPINGMHNKAPGVEGTCVMASYAIDHQNRKFIVLSNGFCYLERARGKMEAAIEESLKDPCGRIRRDRKENQGFKKRICRNREGKGEHWNKAAFYMIIPEYL